jgi:hypothetical protein
LPGARFLHGFLNSLFGPRFKNGANALFRPQIEAVWLRTNEKTSVLSGSFASEVSALPPVPVIKAQVFLTMIQANGLWW